MKAHHLRMSCQSLRMQQSDLPHRNSIPCRQIVSLGILWIHKHIRRCSLVNQLEKSKFDPTFCSGLRVTHDEVQPAWDAAFDEHP